MKTARVIIVLSFAVMVLAVTAIPSSAPAESEAATRWNCRIGGWSGVWEVEGREFVGPIQDLIDVRPHFIIIRNTPEFLVAADTPIQNSPNVAVVTFNKKTLTIELSNRVGASNALDSESGTCKSADSKP